MLCLQLRLKAKTVTGRICSTTQLGLKRRAVLSEGNRMAQISTQRVGTLREKHGRDFLGTGTAWRENLSFCEALGETYRDGACDNQNLITIVDEAHALIKCRQSRRRRTIRICNQPGDHGVPHHPNIFAERVSAGPVARVSSAREYIL